MATLGMLGYGLYSIGSSLLDLVGPFALELWADLAIIGFGALLVLAAALVRVQMPGGLALAIGAMSGLQLLALHTAAHLHGAVAPLPEIVRGAVAGTLVLLAYLGWERQPGAGGPD